MKKFFKKLVGKDDNPSQAAAASEAAQSNFRTAPEESKMAEQAQ